MTTLVYIFVKDTLLYGRCVVGELFSANNNSVTNC